MILSVAVALGAPTGMVVAQTLPVEVTEIIRGAHVRGLNNFSLAFDASGSIYVGGVVSENVVRVAPPGDRAGACVSEVTSRAAADRQGVKFAGPKGIAVGSDGAVYVATTGGPANIDDSVVRIRPDGVVTRLVNREDLGANDWNTAGIAIEERDGVGTFVYATGPQGGGVVRVAPDGTIAQLMGGVGGQGLVLDDATGDLYFAQPGFGVYLIPNASEGVCDVAGKTCPLIIEAVAAQDTSRPVPGCGGIALRVSGTYGLALAGGILYVTGQNSHNVLRVPIRSENALGLPLCIDEPFKTGPGGVLLEQPRAIAADNAGNFYVAGVLTDNLVWVRPDPTDATKTIPQEVVSRLNGLFMPFAVAVDAQGNALVSGNASSNVFRVRTVASGLACGDGFRNPGEPCDYALDCCCTPACELRQAGGPCRGAVGDCDLDDVCDGAQRDCRDARRDAQTVCRPVDGLCDVEERCAGPVSCPEDMFVSSGTECRQVAGACDVAESCTGTGPDCPGDTVLPGDTVCREGDGTCDLIERCNGASAICPEDLARGPGFECSLTDPDLVRADTQCVEELGRCDVDRTCRPVPAIGRPCAPAQSDLRCLRNARCEAPGVCVVDTLPDGELCGNRCDNTVCEAGACVVRAGAHPCGGRDFDHCDPFAPEGEECQLCGNRQLEAWEECDDGNQLGGDGCTPRCTFACDPSAAEPCDQPKLREEIPDPCRRTVCEEVDIDVAVDTEGFACVTETAGCDGCVSDRECDSPDPCADARCKDNMCQREPKLGMARASCAFETPFPGPGTDCGPRDRRNKARTLASLERLEKEAKKLLDRELCSSGSAKPRTDVAKRMRHLLRRAVLRGNTLRSPFRQMITEDCEKLLTDRFERIRSHLEAAEDSDWGCSAPTGG